MIEKILGFGQVLWDLTVEVDYSFIEELAIEIGGHRTVEFTIIEDILLKLEKAQKKVLRNPGGSAANVMSNMAKLGSNTTFCGRHGNDADGYFYMNILESEGVTPISLIDSKNKTGQLLSLITPDKDRTFIVYWGASSQLPEDLITIDLLQKFNLIHIEGYLIINNEKALWKIFNNASKITFDLAAVPIITRMRPVLQEMMKKNPPYILFANFTEGGAFTEKNDPKEILQEMIKYSEIAVLTLGEKGVMVQTKNGDFHYQEAIETDLVDTTGAGDAFSAGFLHEYLQSKDIRKASVLGVKVASKTISKFGARSFQIEQLNNE
ncbi:MAG: carbohydrate kinase family protein [Candidatus Thorarchaeota archaeon]